MTDKGWERLASIFQTGSFLIMGALISDFLNHKTNTGNLFPAIWYLIIPLVSILGLIASIIAANNAGRKS